MSLRIACDLDGTVADMDTALLREAQTLFGPEVALHRSPEEHGPEGGSDERVPRVLSPTEVRRLWSHVRKVENFWMTLAELEPGAIARFAELSARHRWQVVFLTKRPQTAGENSQVQSQRWLIEKGFPLPSVFVMSHSRGVLAGLLGLHAVIDDRPETCLDVVADSKASSILVWRQPERTIPPGVTGLGVRTVPTFHNALDQLEELTSKTASSGLLGRLKSAWRAQ